MPRDGQTIPDDSAILPDLLALTGAAVAPAEALLATADGASCAPSSSVDGRVSGALLEANQTAAHGLAWLATYVESLRQMHAWAERLNGEGKFGEVEQLILQIGVGEYLWQIYGGIPMSQNEILRPQDIGLTQEDQRGLMTDAVMTLTGSGNTQAARTAPRGADAGTFGRADRGRHRPRRKELEMIREQFRRYSVDRVIPEAHEWHLQG